MSSLRTLDGIVHVLCLVCGIPDAASVDGTYIVDNQDVTRKREKSMLVKWPVEALCDWRPCPPRVGTAGTSMHKQAHLGRVTSLDDPATTCLPPKPSRVSTPHDQPACPPEAAALTKQPGTICIPQVSSVAKRWSATGKRHSDSLT